jgi:hypothetical protein
LHILQGLFREAIAYSARHFAESAQPEGVEVSMDELEAKAKELGLHDIASFYKSQVFKSHHFQLNEDRRAIIKLV